MKKYLFFLPIFLLFFALFLSGCGQKPPQINVLGGMDYDSIKQQFNTFQNEEKPMESLFKALPGGEYLVSVERDEEGKISVFYGLLAQGEEATTRFLQVWTYENMKQVFLNNALAAFSLQEGISQIDFRIRHTVVLEAVFSKDALVQQLGVDLEKEWDNASWDQEIITEIMGSKKTMGEFFNNHPISPTQEI